MFIDEFSLYILIDKLDLNYLINLFYVTYSYIILQHIFEHYFYGFKLVPYQYKSYIRCIIVDQYIDFTPFNLLHQIRFDYNFDQYIDQTTINNLPDRSCKSAGYNRHVPYTSCFGLEF